MSNQSTTLYLQVILLAPQVQGLLEVLDSPRIKINIEKTEKFYLNCYYSNSQACSTFSREPQQEQGHGHMCVVHHFCTPAASHGVASGLPGALCPALGQGGGRNPVLPQESHPGALWEVLGSGTRGDDIY